MPNLNILDEQEICRYLSYLWKPGSGEVFKNLRSVPPGGYTEMTKKILIKLSFGTLYL